MRPGIFVSIFLAAFFSVSPLLAEEALTLQKAYELALKRSEDIAILGEEVSLAEGRFQQVLSVAWPTVSFVITRSEQDAPEASGSDGATGNLLRRVTPQKKFVFSQPLFTGFKEFAAMNAAGAENAQRRFEQKRAEELLFIDVMDVFYNLAQARREDGILEEVKKIYKARLQELSGRIRLGRSRPSESQSTLLDLKLSEVQIEEVRRLEVISRQLLEFYIGRPVMGKLSEDDSAIEAAPGLAVFLVGVARRADVQAAREAYESQRHKIMVARSGFFPSAKLDGNYYAQRVGVQSGVDWDALFTVDVPVFEGTKTVGEMKEAGAAAESARLHWSRVQRSAELEIRNAHEAYTASKRRAAASLAAAEAAWQNYKSNDSEYGRNLVGNLELLDSLRLYQDTWRGLNEASYRVKRDFWKLKVAAGVIARARSARSNLVETCHPRASGNQRRSPLSRG